MCGSYLVNRAINLILSISVRLRIYVLRPDCVSQQSGFILHIINVRVGPHLWTVSLCGIMEHQINDHNIKQSVEQETSMFHHQSRRIYGELRLIILLFISRPTNTANDFSIPWSYSWQCFSDTTFALTLAML